VNGVFNGDDLCGDKFSLDLRPAEQDRKLFRSPRGRRCIALGQPTEPILFETLEVQPKPVACFARL
jgi:hypothetical protein